MNDLIAQLQRLYFLPGQKSLAGDAGAALDLVGTDGQVRTMAVSFTRAADWEHVSKLYRGVQEDLDLPAPAISVAGKAGYQVWFSLADSVPLEQARAFLKALHLKYLADIPPAKLDFHPDVGEPASTEHKLLPQVPALIPETGKWSAFIDPSMGAMFSDEPWLEMAPNLEKQADLLAGFESIKAGDFERAMNGLLQQVEPDADAVAASSRTGSKLNVGSHFSDPKSFLLAVMNDPSASAKQRIKAAKALLPYFERMPN